MQRDFGLIDQRLGIAGVIRQKLDLRHDQYKSHRRNEAGALYNTVNSIGCCLLHVSLTC